MPRTAGQKAADEALTAAIEQVRAAYYPGDIGQSALADYLVVWSEMHFTDDGDRAVAVGIHARDSDLPPHQQLGLVAYADTRIRDTINAD